MVKQYLINLLFFKIIRNRIRIRLYLLYIFKLFKVKIAIYFL